MRKEYLIIVGIFLIALAAMLIQFSVWYDLSDLATPLDEASFGALDPTSAFTGQAISLVRTGTYNFGGPGYLGLTQRGPAYATIVAGGLLIFGEYVWVVMLVNMLLLWAALFFLWRIARQLLSGLWAFLPALLLAMYWEVSVFATFGSYETFALAVATLTVLSLINYSDSKKVRWLIIAALAYGFWILEKPIVILAIFPFIVFIVVSQYSRLKKCSLATHVLLFAVIVGIIVGAWSFRNERVLGTRELGTGGVILLRRTSQVNFNFSEVVSMWLSFAMGDYVGSKLYDNFPSENSLPAEPKTWDPAIEARLNISRFYGFDGGYSWMVTDIDGTSMTRTDFDARLKEEAIQKIKERPIKFFLLGFVNLFRLNSPVNYGGQEIMHTFVGSHDNLSPLAKTAIIIFIRLLWYAFLALVIFGIIRHAKDWRMWGLVALIVIYYNVMYAFLTHAEVRYILTAIPFYLIFFTDSIRFLYETYSTGRS
jgi:hypothetical protein